MILAFLAGILLVPGAVGHAQNQGANADPALYQLQTGTQAAAQGTKFAPPSGLNPALAPPPAAEKETGSEGMTLTTKLVLGILGFFGALAVLIILFGYLPWKRIFLPLKRMGARFTALWRPRMVRAGLLTLCFLLALAAVGYFVFGGHMAKPAEAGWWNDSWSYRKAITINHNKVTADLANFPMLVSLTDSNLGTHAQSNGNDIVFIDSSGHKLSHEIEKFASSTGELVAWVKIPTLSSTQDETIYMYYGNAGVASEQDAANVWDSNYVGVWHLPDSATASGTDSTINGNNGSVENGASTTASAKVDGGMGFDGTSNQYVNVGTSNKIFQVGQPMTISAWIYAHSSGNGSKGKIISRRATADNHEHCFSTYDTNTLDFELDGSGTNLKRLAANDSITLNTWQYVTVTWGGTTNYSDVHILVNGVETSYQTNANGSGTYSSDGEPTRIGNRADGARTFDGIIDEVQISDIVRSADWIKTSYNNQNSPSTFLSSQAEETGPGPVGYWSFDEGYGTTAHDETANKNDGTISGATWQSEDMCVAGKCLLFDGTNDKVTVSGTASGTKTVVFWAKATSTTATFLKLNDLARITVSGGAISASGFASPTIYVNGFATDHFEANKWQMIAVTTDTGINATSTVLGYGAGQYYGGFLDEVKIYPYARTADQIRQDYAAGLAGMKTNHGVSAAFGSQSDKWMTDGLVGYWKFDESATTSGAIDSSGNENTGTYEGDASTTAGKFGNGGVFDGNGSYVDCGSTASLADLGPLTVSFWMKPTTLTLYDEIISKAIDPNSGQEWELSITNVSNQRIEFHKDLQGGTDIAVTWNNTAVTGEWQHIVVTWDGQANSAGVSLYRNGILVPQTSGLGGGGVVGSDSSQSFIIGKAARNYGGTFDGKIDEVRIYNRVLSPDEVEKLYEWAPGPVAWWKMDDQVKGDGQQIVDSSGYGNTGTTSSANGKGMDCTVPGKYGTACEFDGVDDKIVDSSPSGLPSGSGAPWTLEAWVKAYTETASTRTILSYGNGGNNQTPDIAHSLINKWRVGVYGTSLDSGNVEIGKWTYVVGVCDGSNINLYINGQFEAGPTAVTDDPVNTNLMVGYLSGHYFNGLIDDVRIYNYACTQKEILEDMHGSIPGSAGQGHDLYPVLDLNFDEGYGATAHDSSGYGNDGTLHPGTGGTNTNVSEMWTNDGKVKNAIDLDGTDDYASIPVSNIFNLATTSSYTWSVWVKPNNFSEWSELFSMEEDADNAFYIYVHTTTDTQYGPVTKGISAVWESASTGASLSAHSLNNILDNDRFYHVTVRYEGNKPASEKFTIFVNTKDVTDRGDISGGGVLGNLDPTYVSVGIDRYFTTDKFGGLIDEVKFYPYALTADEVKEDYNEEAAAVMGTTGMATTTAATGQTVNVPTNAASSQYCVPDSTDYCAPPVGEWKFDEMGGTIAHDSSGNGNDGTINGATWTPLGKVGSALNFNNSYVNLKSPNSLNNLNTFTYEVWVKADSSNTSESVQPIMEKGAGSYTKKSFRFDYLNNGNAIFLFRASTTDAESVSTNHTVVAGIWQHWTITYDDSGDRIARIYLDGKEVSYSQQTAAQGPALDDSSNEMWIGETPCTGFYDFEGVIDDVKIFNYVRTPAQIAWDYDKGAAVAEWRFNECQGSTIHDESNSCKNGDCNNGTLHLGTAGVTATGTCASSSNSFWYNGRNGHSNSAGSFDGTDDYVEIPNNNEINFSTTTNFSISVWFVGNSGADANVLIDKRDTTSPYRGYHMWLSDYNTGVGFQLNDNNYHVYDHIGSGLGYRDGKWHNYVLSVDFNNHFANVYVDGINIGNNIDISAVTGDITNSQTLTIGWNHQTYHFSGLIDDVKIWNYALTSEQVKTEYNSGAVSFGN